MPSGPGVISEETIAEIAAAVPPGVATFLLTSQQDAEAIIAQQRRCRVNTLQLVDRLQRGSYEDLRRALPGIKIVQVIHVTGKESVAEAVAVAAQVDAILLDSGNPALQVKELGGTGRVHDWRLSKQIRDRLPIPLYLAGGLKPENVAAAIRQVSPFGLDICSGVRTDGKLDQTKLAAFFAAVRAASQAV
jgi:phosphoribosylanthranilate isomerase